MSLYARRSRWVSLWLILPCILTLLICPQTSHAQRRRGRRAHAPTVVVPSHRVSEELGGIQWGWTREQVIEDVRLQLATRYAERLRNVGQIEQERILQERNRELETFRSSLIVFNGADNQRRWDHTYLSGEYSHGHNESMLIREDSANSMREFYFFVDNHLWKRYQARLLPTDSPSDFTQFVAGLEQMFGPTVNRSFMANDPTRLEFVSWQDDTTQLRVVDRARVFNIYGLVFEDRSMLARIEQIRHTANR